MTDDNCWGDILDRLLERIEVVARESDIDKGISRHFLSPANLRVADLIMSWMRGSGLEVSHTSDGSIRGVLPGTHKMAKPLVIGSHFDTVVSGRKIHKTLPIKELRRFFRIECFLDY